MKLTFALLLASVLSVGGESTQPWFVSVYRFVSVTPMPLPHALTLPTFPPRPENNVNAYASLDLDMREIQSLVAAGE